MSAPGAPVSADPPRPGRRRRGALRAAGLFVAAGPPIGLGLTVVVSTVRSGFGAWLHPQMFNPLDWLLIICLSYVVGGPAAIVTGAVVGGVSPDTSDRSVSTMAVAIGAGAVATLAWLRLITAGFTSDHLVTAAVGAASAALCLRLRSAGRGFQADPAGPRPAA